MTAKGVEKHGTFPYCKKEECNYKIASEIPESSKDSTAEPASQDA
jgi:hypothetical protein